MDKTNVTKRVTATILSMSLLTVMAGAAIAPEVTPCLARCNAYHRIHTIHILISAANLRQINETGK